MEEKQKVFKTLKGFLAGEEADEERFKFYSATLRISGENLNFSEIERSLMLKPTYSHRKVNQKGKRSPGFQSDMWSYQPNIDGKVELEKHILALWEKIKAHKHYLLYLKKEADIDVYLGYRSNIDTAGIEVSYKCLEMFTELEIPFGISIIVC
jgi:hypothetical protein